MDRKSNFPLDSGLVLAGSLAIAASITLCVGLQGAHAQQLNADSAAIESEFRAWQAALIARDSATLYKISAPEFVQVEGQGGQINRQVAIGMPTTSPDYRVESVNIESVQVTVSGDVGQLKGVTLVRENFSGRVYNTRKSVSETWARRGGRWFLTREELVELK